MDFGVYDGSVDINVLRRSGSCNKLLNRPFVLSQQRDTDLMHNLSKTSDIISKASDRFGRVMPTERAGQDPPLQLYAQC